MKTENEDSLSVYPKADDQQWQDDLFAILDRLKSTSPQSKTHSASVTVKVGDHVEVSYSITIVKGDLDERFGC